MRVDNFIFIVIVSVLSVIYGVYSLIKYNKEEIASKKDNYVGDGGLKQDIYGIIIIGVIGLIGSIIIYVAKF